MLLDETKKSNNTILFKECVEKINGHLGLGYGLDEEWIDMSKSKGQHSAKKSLK